MQTYADGTVRDVKQYSSIRATVPVIHEMREMCSKGDTYNDFLKRMLLFVKRHQREFMRDNKKDESRLQRDASDGTEVIIEDEYR